MHDIRSLHRAYCYYCIYIDISIYILRRNKQQATQ
jgi:hypothetical protein